MCSDFHRSESGTELLARLEGRSSLKEIEPYLFADEDSPVHGRAFSVCLFKMWSSPNKSSIKTPSSNWIESDKKKTNRLAGTLEAVRYPRQKMGALVLLLVVWIWSQRPCALVSTRNSKIGELPIMMEDHFLKIGNYDKLWCTEEPSRSYAWCPTI
ncbi:DNA repair protein XRCC2 isoform X6 [Lepus europaeus]|uniref:DNA repair protein XRCC2 isoform X6 n=1 Tax=Lepus europaeus TaxID=9983 RepID=UPI002B49519C|nr:DNA repair protein XRCC2 isoform X6 [Lepus europaeus]